MRGFSFVLSIFPVMTMTFAQTPTVSYTLSMPEPWTHLFTVEVLYSGLPASTESFDLQLPAWRSGRYDILDFAGSVQEFSAVDDKGTVLPWEKTDKQTWRIQKKGRSVVLARYRVYANEFNLRTKGLNDEGAFLDGSSAFMYNEHYRSLPAKLTVLPYKNWHVTTGLDRTRDNPPTFTAPGYDYLIDCPLFIGTQKDYEFMAEGKKHVLSLMGEGNYSAEKIIDDLKKLIHANKNFWGRLPYDRYVFMVHVSSNRGGGTEHINSTIMGAQSFMFTDPAAYQGFLSLASHEFFHTWNVKQIRPRGISPYDWTKENYTRELWIGEGTTEYYEPLLLARAGLLTAETYLQRLPSMIEDERRKPGNRVQSAVESSFDAWVKFSQNQQNSYNAETDFYTRGSDLSMALDLEIRHRTNNAKSLDDVLRAMFERFPWNGTGYTVDDFQAICEEIAAGSFKDFFTRSVHGTENLPWETFLSYAGLEVEAKKGNDPWLGISVQDQGEKTNVRLVVAGSPAYRAGLNVNDELIALNGYRVRASELPRRLSDMKIGDRVRVTVMRGNRLRDFEVALEPNPVPAYTIRRTQLPTPLQKSIYESWLGQAWPDQAADEGGH